MFPDMCACVSICDSQCVRACVQTWDRGAREGEARRLGGGRYGRGRGACSTLPVTSHVSQKGRKVLTANSLHSSVSERSAHIRRLHGRKHNLFDATLPTRPEPSSPRWRFTLFNFHFIFRTGRQTGEAGGRVQGTDSILMEIRISIFGQT